MTHGKAAGVLAAGALALAGCVTTDDETGNVAAMAATYRYLFANNVSGLQQGAATYCVGVGARPGLDDPSPVLLASLADIGKVEPASTCTVGERVTDAEGRPSLLFNLALLGCDAPDNCLFEGGYYEANLSASNGRYRARKVGGEWQVTPEGPQAVS